MRYFIKEHEEAQKKVESSIEQVKMEILRHLGNRVTAIILIGGLARGEGAWKEANGQLKVISDLDLLVSTRWGTKVSKELQDELRRLGDQTGIEIAPRFVNNSELRFSPNSTELLDIKEIGIPIYGEKATLSLPEFDRDTIGFKDIVYLFFNRVYLSIDECSPDDCLSSDSGALERLSRGAVQTMFTCADFVTIHGHNYCSSVFDRVRFVKDNIFQQNMDIDKNEFLADLDKAVEFKFEQTDKLYLNDAREFWLRARSHLINLFLLLFEQKFGTREISRYSYLQLKESPFGARARLALSRLRKVLKLIKMKKIPSFRNVPDPHFYCRMAWLMLYLALGESTKTEYLTKAEDYLAKVYRFKRRRLNAEEKWLALQDEARRLRQLGVA